MSTGSRVRSVEVIGVPKLRKMGYVPCALKNLERNTEQGESCIVQYWNMMFQNRVD